MAKAGRLGERAVAQVAEKAAGQPPCAGRSPSRCAGGHYKIKLNKQGYRLVYGVEDDVLIVMVMAVDKREDSAVYQSAMARVTEKDGGPGEGVASSGQKHDRARPIACVPPGPGQNGYEAVGRRRVCRLSAAFVFAAFVLATM